MPTEKMQDEQLAVQRAKLEADPTAYVGYVVGVLHGRGVYPNTLCGLDMNDPDRVRYMTIDRGDVTCDDCLALA
jgi:hypothetical protein